MDECTTAGWICNKTISPDHSEGSIAASAYFLLTGSNIHGRLQAQRIVCLQAAAGTYIRPAVVLIIYNKTLHTMQSIVLFRILLEVRNTV
jgi:hypothetical protein